MEDLAEEIFSEETAHARHVALCTCTLHFILNTLYFVPALYLALYLLCIWTGGGYRVDTLH